MALYLLPCSKLKLAGEYTGTEKEGSVPIINVKRVLQFACGECLAKEDGLATLDEAAEACKLCLKGTEATIDTRRGNVALNNFEA